MSIIIFGQVWNIKECSNSEIPMNDGLFYGRTFYFDKTIYLNKDSTIEQKQQTLRHELTHAFIHETQVISQEKDFSFTEEMLCEFVGKYGNEIENIANKYFNKGE